MTPLDGAGVVEAPTQSIRNPSCPTGSSRTPGRSTGRCGCRPRGWPEPLYAFLDRKPEGLTALVMEGEAGIGKSTVWLAGVAAARARSFRVLTSRPAETERMLANLVLGDLFGDTAPEVLATLPAPRRRAF